MEAMGFARSVESIRFASSVDSSGFMKSVESIRFTMFMDSIRLARLCWLFDYSETLHILGCTSKNVVGLHRWRIQTVSA